jgi:hypothetical protein
MRKLWIALGLALLALLGTWTGQQIDNRTTESAAPSPSAEVASATGSEVELRPALAEKTIEDPAVEARTPVIVEQARPQPAPASHLSAAISVLAASKETKAPIQGLSVRVTLEGIGYVLDRANTDPHGRADLQVSSGLELCLRAEHLGGECAATSLRIAPLAPGENRQVDLAIATQADLHFFAHVVSAEDGEVVKGASAAIGRAFDFSLNSEGRLEPSPATRPTTDSVVHFEADGAGYCQLEVPSWKVDSARVSAPGYAWVIVPLGPGHEHRNTACEVLLSRAAALDAQVLDVARRPIAGSRIRLEALNRNDVVQSDDSALTVSMEDVLWEAITDQDGRARIERLPPRVELSLDIIAPGRRVQQESRTLRFEPGELRQIEVVIGSGATIAGSLTQPDGSPRPRVEIWLQHAEAWSTSLTGGRKNSRIVSTDAQGRFTFSDVLDGQWRVGVDPDGPLAPVREEVSVREGVADREVNLTAWSDLFIRGKVLDPQGKAFSHAYVMGSDPETHINVSAETDASGEFVLGPLADGVYFVSAEPWHGASLVQSEDQQLRAGTSDVVIRLRPGGQIRIQWTGPDGATTARVQLRPQLGTEGTSSEMSQLRPGAREQIVFDVEPGIYSVSVVSGSLCGVLSGIQVGAGDDIGPFDLAVRPAGRVRVHYDGTAQWATLEAVQGNACVQMDFLEPNGSLVWVVPPGELELVCTEWIGDGSQPRSTRHLVIAVGETADERFGPEQGGK